MRITPLDIGNHAFPTRFSGYDREEVDAFLGMIAEDYEAVVREAEALREEVVKLKARVEGLAANEAILQETLVTAQTLSEDLKNTAAKESELMIAEAEIRAEKILDAAHRRAARLAEDIREMKALRTRLAAAVRAAIEAHLGLLDGLAQDLPEEPLLEGEVACLAHGAEPAKPGEKA